MSGAEQGAPATRRPQWQLSFVLVPGTPSTPTPSLPEHLDTAKATIADSGVSARQYAVDVIYAARMLKQ